MGCSFKAPLTERPTRDVDPALTGSWFSLKDGKTLDVFKLSAREYLVVDDGEPYVCTHSDYEGVPFVSCRQIGNNDRHGLYAFVAFMLKDGELTITPLNDELKLSAEMSPEAVRTALSAAIRRGNVLDPDSAHQTHYRKKE